MCREGGEIERGERDGGRSVEERDGEREVCLLVSDLGEKLEIGGKRTAIEQRLP